MNFDFSDEQKQLKDEARRFLTRECPSERLRAVLDAPEKGYDQALWKAVAGQGWLGASIPEEFGGLGLGYLELCCIAEELGRSLAPIPFASSVYFFAEAVMLAGSEEQKRKYLPGIASGDLIGALASSEQPGPVTAATVKASVQNGKLNGVKLPVTDGGIATTAIVLALASGKPSLFIVDLRDKGVVSTALDTIDPTRNVTQLTFADVPVERLGEEGEGLDLIARVFDRAAVLLAFEQVGGSDRCLEMAREYALARFAFGRAIGAYQAIKHKLADMYIKNVLARSNAYYGAWALNTDAQELPVAASGARIAASDAYWFGAKENIQTHGGMGFTWELDCHLYYRRSRQLALVAGAPRIWKERLIYHIERRNAA